MISLIFVKFNDIWTNNQLIFSGNDFTFEIFITKLAIEGNLQGISKNVGWPNGFAVWSNPLFGIGPYYLSFVVKFILNFLSIYQIYFITFSVGIAMNAVCGYWMAEKEFERKIYPIIFGLMIGISPFALTRVGHMPVAWLFFPLLFFGVLFRLNRKQISFSRAIVMIFVGGIFSPLWWTIVVLFITLVITFLYLISPRKSIDQLKIWATIFMSILFSMFAIILLVFRSKDYLGIGSRTPWQSDVFGGYFSDILVSSPLLNKQFHLRDRFLDGLSPEATKSSIGLILGICVIILFVFLLREHETNTLAIPKDFKKISLVIFFFFFVGGFGNLQSAVFVLLNQTSPARAWFRLIFLLGVLGLFLLLKYFDQIKLSNINLILLSFIFIFISLLDLKYSDRIQLINKQDLIEYGPTQFLDSKTKNCPVLQLPVDTYPLMQDFLGENGSKFGYPQMIPYTLSSNNKWSLVATPENKFWQDYKSLPTEIDESNIKTIKDKGFCAIWFDKDFSTWQINRKAGLDFTQGLWPGLRVSLTKIDFENERYQVYLINN